MLDIRRTIYASSRHSYATTALMLLLYEAHYEGCGDLGPTSPLPRKGCVRLPPAASDPFHECENVRS
jgi:hypothetical protein